MCICYGHSYMICKKINLFCSSSISIIGTLQNPHICTDLVTSHKKEQEILKQNCKDLFILVELPNIWLLPDSTIEQRHHEPLARHINLYILKSLTLNQKRLKFWFQASYTCKFTSRSWHLNHWMPRAYSNKIFSHAVGVAWYVFKWK